MADATGALHVTHDGRQLTLRLTWAGFARLEAMHPDVVKPMISGGEAVPTMRFALDAVSVGLQKGSGLTQAEADEMADDLLTADPGLLARLIQASSPGAAAPGNGQAMPEAGG